MSEVEKLLQDKNIHFVPKGKDVLVKCFNPEHEDTNPSMRIDRESGKYHCFSCGYKGNLFDDFKVVRNRLTSKVRDVLEKVNSLRKASNLALPVDAFPFNKPYRGIKAITMTKFEAFEAEKDFADRVVFPIRDGINNVVSFIGRYKDSDAKPKYLVKPSGVPLPLFPHPSKVDPIKSSIILVEGIFDMINCHDKGLENVVCVFGTDQVSSDNAADKLLPYQMIGVDTIYIMYDGDKAGKAAAAKTEKAIKYSTNLLVEIINLPEDIDPGDLSQKDVTEIKNYLLNR